MRHVIEFKLAKETKGAVQYKEVKNGRAVSQVDGVIGTLYIRKTQIDGVIPQGLTVTVESTEE